MKMASEGAVEMTPKWVSHFDTCLGCMACMTSCPSGVDYGKLIESTRAQIERRYPRSWAEKLHRRFLFETFTRPDRLQLLRWPLLAYQKSGLKKLLRGLGVFRALPKSIAAMEALMPQVGRQERVSALTPATGAKRKRVGLLLGCVQRVFFSSVNAATVRVLSAEGYEVVAPEEQPCCGALPVHAGEEEAALQLARKTIDVFENAGVEIIVTNAAGCGSNVKEYGHLLRDDPQYASRARAFAAKCKDISEILCESEPRVERKPLPIRVAFHDSCHLQHAQNVRVQPRALLSAIPGIQLSEIPEAPICCGSAGIFNLVQPDTANELGDRKAALIRPLKADVVSTGNPGCLLQLQAALGRTAESIPVVHHIQILDASIRGLKLEELQRSQ